LGKGVRSHGALPGCLDRHDIGAGRGDGARGVEGGGDVHGRRLPHLVEADDGNGHNAADRGDVVGPIDAHPAGPAPLCALRQGGDDRGIPKRAAGERLAGDDEAAAQPGEDRVRRHVLLRSSHVAASSASRSGECATPAACIASSSAPTAGSNLGGTSTALGARAAMAALSGARITEPALKTPPTGATAAVPSGQVSLRTTAEAMAASPSAPVLTREIATAS